MKTVGKVFFWILVLAAAGVLIFSCYQLITINMEYSAAVKTYDAAVDAYVTENPAASEDSGSSADLTDGISDAEKSPAEKAETAPISVDFDDLQKQNPEVIGWIYCADTVINYPVMQTDDDSYYLHHSWLGESNSSGAIFLASENSPDFTDLTSFLYGHHMKNGSMFRSIQYYKDQEYYDEHPVLWLLTPEQDYKIVLFTGYVTQGVSDTYVIYYDNGEENEKFHEYIGDAASKSTFTPDLPDDIDPDTPVLTLSTCDYSFSNARYVVQGYLIPVGR